MKTLIVGDIHNKHKNVEPLLSKWDGNIIFVGDYFDDFYDTPNDAISTALWLKESLTKENRIHLMGNHDFHYMLPLDCGIYCSGYTDAKHKSIKSILTKEDWDKVKYFHEYGKYWISHAGITKNWFSHPVKGFDINSVEFVIDKTKGYVDSLLFEGMGAFYAADSYRGGSYEKGGLLWNDWRNTELIDGVIQIVGHTPSNRIQIKTDGINYAYNVDCWFEEFLIIYDEGCSQIVKSVDLFNQYGIVS
jgi:hypothetical protein